MVPDTKTRVALWQANQRKCFYCSEPVFYKDLEIDHIVPEKITADQLIQLRSRIALPANFELNAVCNLVPTHHNCNNHKSGILMDDNAIVFYVQLWAQKQNQIQREIEKHVKAAARDRYLIGVSKLIESGELTKQEIWQIISKIQPSVRPTPQDPLVITFGINVSDLLASGAAPPKAGDTYITVCDWLESDLLFRVSGSLPTLAAQPEASARNGETLSVRIAFWNLDLDRLDQFDLSHWEILEIANFTELYDTSPDDFLAKAVVKASGSVVADPWDTAFGVGRCPRCGSDKLKRSSSIDHYYDETYYTIECQHCGWLEWTQQEGKCSPMNYKTRKHVDLHVIDAINKRSLSDWGFEADMLKKALHGTSINIVPHAAHDIKSMNEAIRNIGKYRETYITPRHSVPYVHISCHGRQDALILGESEEMPWDTLSEALLPLLETTDYHLALSLSSCWGYHGASLAYVMSKKYRKMRPYYSLVGPPDREDIPSLCATFADFYRQLLLNFKPLKRSIESANGIGTAKLDYTYGSHVAYRLWQRLTGNW